MMTAFTSRVFRLLAAAQMSLAFLLLANSAWARSHDELCADLLPEDALASLQNQFPGFYPQKVSDLSAEYQDAWLKEHPQECPGIAVGHFQNPSKIAYAVLLIGSKGSLSGSRLAIVTQSAGGWKVTKLTEQAIEYHYEAVSKISPGRSKHKAGATALSGTLDRIQLKEFDGDATVYSWSAGRFHRVTKH